MEGTNYSVVKSSVMRKLERGLPKHLYFHNISLTENIINSVKTIVSSEEVTEEDVLMLKLGALYKNIGFMEQYFNYEEKSKEIAKDTLLHFGYPNKQIIKVLKLVMAKTRPSHEQRNRLEQIMCDADLDHLGREDFFIRNELLRLELQAQLKIDKREKIIIPLKLWYGKTLEFLENHKYFTQTAKSLRQEGKEQNIEQLKELLGKF